MTDRPPLIALLTDFGTTDAYVAAMKGVIHTLAPQAHIVDITHEINPQDVRQAAYVLLTTCPYFPLHTIFVAVVDPGVGTERRAIAASCVHGRFIGPDNGIFSYVFTGNPATALVEITNPAYILKRRSNTFHGRDIFAPAAAHLANGVPLDALGPAAAEVAALPPPRLEIAKGHIKGEVIYIDRFGNAVTSVGSLVWNGETHLTLLPRFGASTHPTRFTTKARVSIGSVVVRGVRPSYGHVAPGTLLALVNSAGQLEVAVNQGSAAQILGIAVGDAVSVRLE
ncbi:MAG: SAM-dependent chlorinase/fluorinase [Anaerolineae bacterium]|nr:SAM-dependent chlorinase/fluorinase [Anaerolineae bacterium]